MRRHELAPMYVVSPTWWSVATGIFGVLLTLGFWDAYANPWLVLAMAVVSGPLMGIPLSRAGDSWGRFVPLGWCLPLAVVLFQTEVPLRDVAVVWPVLASAVALGGLAMIGNTITVVVAMLLNIGVGCLWGLRHRLTVAHALELTTFTTPVLIGICYGIVMHRAFDAADAATAEEGRARQRLLELESREDARAVYQSNVAEVSGHLLDRMASGQRLTEAERVECGLVEAQLRDAIRGRSLATEEVLLAARHARSRGARVLLVDDRRNWDCPDELRLEVLATAVAALDVAGRGDSCTIRLHPPGRKNLATVLLGRGETDSIRQDFQAPGRLSTGAVDASDLS